MAPTMSKLGAGTAALVVSGLASVLFPHMFATDALTKLVAFFVSSYTVFIVLYKIIIYPFLTSPLRHLPQGRGFRPLVGHELTLFKRPGGQPHLNMMKEVENDGLILTRGWFHSDKLIVTSPAALAEVLAHKNYDFEKPPRAREFLRRILGDGLLMTEGDEHKHHRKNILPAFHFRHIKELYPIFWSKSIEFCNAVARARQDSEDKILEIGHYSTQVTLDIIGLAGLGRDINSLRNSEDDLIANYEELLEPTTEKAVFFLMHLLFPTWFIATLPWKLNERIRIMTTNLKQICIDFVIQKKSALKTQSTESLDILSIMLKSNNFSDSNLVDQLLTFLAAGHETTSSTLTWSTYLLSKYPAMQSKLRAEIHTHIPDPQALSDPSTDIATLLESMPFLNAVCNEVLRMFPTIPLTARMAVRDTNIAGRHIPQGTICLIVPWAVNRNPALWGPDAEEFVPERWIDENGRTTMNGGADSNYAFLTFLHGPRSCIGERFARAELRALLAALVGSFEFEMADPNEEVLVGGTVTSKPKNGMRLKLTPVEWGQ